MKANLKRCVVGLLFVAFLASVTAGCKNTAQGAGKDIEIMGEKIQEKTK